MRSNGQGTAVPALPPPAHSKRHTSWSAPQRILRRCPTAAAPLPEGRPGSPAVPPATPPCRRDGRELRKAETAGNREARQMGTVQSQTASRAIHQGSTRLHRCSPIGGVVDKGAADKEGARQAYGHPQHQAAHACRAAEQEDGCCSDAHPVKHSRQQHRAERSLARTVVAARRRARYRAAPYDEQAHEVEHDQQQGVSSWLRLAAAGWPANRTHSAPT